MSERGAPSGAVGFRQTGTGSGSSQKARQLITSLPVRGALSSSVDFVPHAPLGDGSVVLAICSLELLPASLGRLVKRVCLFIRPSDLRVGGWRSEGHGQVGEAGSHAQVSQ